MLSRLSLRTRLLLGVVVLAAVGLVAADVATYSALSSYPRCDAPTRRWTRRRARGRLERRRRCRSAPARRLRQVRALDGAQWSAMCSELRRYFGARTSPPRKLPARRHAARAADTRDGDASATSPSASRDGGRAVPRPRLGGAQRSTGRCSSSRTSLRDVNSTLHRLLLDRDARDRGSSSPRSRRSASGSSASSLRPLRRIEQTAEAITAGDLSRRVEYADPQTEVGRVGQRAQHDARPDRGVGPAPAPLHRRRVARAADAAGRRPRLRRAVRTRRGRRVPTISSARCRASRASPSG